MNLSKSITFLFKKIAQSLFQNAMLVMENTQNILLERDEESLS